MDRRYKVKVWKDRMAGAHPAKWAWEVVDRVNGGKIVGCGTTFSQGKSQAAAAHAVEQRDALLQQRRASRSGGLYRQEWATSDMTIRAFADHPSSRGF